jgi:gamma-glutamylcyclotransferase (GGCT)/AIG2-like uncharacterized protein YtfP
MDKILVFVYGTLKRGCRNNHYLSEAMFLGEAETVEKYSMRRHKYWYPTVIETLEYYNIIGELWCCSESTLKSLDRLEGYPDLFYRKEVPVIQDAKVINAWVYFFNYTYLKNELKEQILEWKED